MIELAIFDLDGVILHGRYFSDRFQEAYGVSSEEVVQILKTEVIAAKSENIPTFPIWERHLKEWGIELTEEEFFTFWFQGDEIVEEVLAIAKAVANKVDHIVILSDNFQERIAWLRKAFDFWGIFEKVYFSSEIGYSKDTKEGFENVMRDFNVTANQVFFVDDSGSAIRTAQELGINAYQFKDNNVDGLKSALKDNGIEF